MTDKRIYDLWLSRTSDLRYLRPRRWKEIKEVIFDRKISSVLEFGSGVSTILFNNLGLKVLSLETDPIYMEFVRSLCPNGVSFMLWDNRSTVIHNHYDFALVDGILPRTDQVRLATEHARIVAIDDFNESPGLRIPPVFKRMDPGSTTLAMFERAIIWQKQ